MPVDRGYLHEQLRALGEDSSWWEHRELRDLPAVLDDDEQLLAISRGKIARVRWLRRPWLVVVTDRRLLCVRSARRSGWRQLEVAADRITRTALRVGPFRGRVLIRAGGESYRLLLPRAQAYSVEAALASLRTTGGAPALRLAPGRLVHRLIDHVLALPAVAFSPDAPTALPAPSAAAATAAADAADALDDRLQRLENQVLELRQQVEFLEDLLHDRGSGAPTRGPATAETAPDQESDREPDAESDREADGGPDREPDGEPAPRPGADSAASGRR